MAYQNKQEDRQAGTLSNFGLILDRFSNTSFLFIFYLYFSLGPKAWAAWMIFPGAILFALLIDFLVFKKKLTSSDSSEENLPDKKKRTFAMLVKAFFTLAPYSPDEEDAYYYPRLLVSTVSGIAALALVAFLMTLYPAWTRWMPDPLRFNTVARGLNHFERPTQEREVLREMASNGYAPAQTQLGILLERGQGGLPDIEEAAHWFQLAHDNGDITATAMLGYYYDEGLGVPKDCRKAMALNEQAAALGDGIAMNNLAVAYSTGECVPVDHDKAVPLFREAAKKGNRHALLALGYNYEHGLGVEQNFEEARIRYVKLAEEGDPSGQVNLAVLLLNKGGNGNTEEALTWLEKALKQEDPNAIDLLGDVLRNHPEFRTRFSPYLSLLQS